MLYSLHESRKCTIGIIIVIGEINNKVIDLLPLYIKSPVEESRGGIQGEEEFRGS